MDTLNTDCLIEIVKFLNLNDQIALKQVNTGLQEAVLTLWSIKHKHFRINFFETELTTDEWLQLLSSIKDIVEEMQLRFLPKEHYEIVFKRFRYEKLKNFRFTLCDPYLEDSDIKVLTKLLPNLTAFSPHGDLTGLHMDKWPKLKDINLGFCRRLEVKNFQSILKNLKLEKLKLNIFPNNKKIEQLNLEDAQLEYLKYLELNTYEFYYFVAKPLTSLKELIITNHYNPRQLFDVLLSAWPANQIHKIETANIDHILVNCLEMHMNVEELFIVNDVSPLPTNIISSLHLLTDLRKLHFKNCSFVDLDFSYLLKNIPQITEISFENPENSLYNIVLTAEDIGGNRLTKLRLNMYNDPYWSRMGGEYNYMTVKLIGSHPFFELTQLEGPRLCYEPLRVVYR